MRKISSIVTLITAVVAVSTTANAQATATAASGATIVTPISITKQVDLNFGNVAVTTTAGTVMMTPGGVRSTTGGVTLPTTTGTVAAASFTVGGQADYTYNVTLPTADITLAGLTPANTMSLGSFTSSPSDTAGALLSGTQTLTVGGTLTVKASQEADTYANAADLTVTVNYN